MTVRRLCRTQSLSTRDRNHLKRIHDRCILLNRIMVCASEGDELYLRMPIRKIGDNTQKDVFHPISGEARKEMTEVILAAYRADSENRNESAAQ